MTFDNSKSIINLRIKLFFATILLIAWIIIVFVAKVIKFPLLGLTETAWTLILVAIYLIILFLPMIMNYEYVYFSDEEEHIVIRYFFAGMIGGKKNSISINKRTFAGYKYEKKYWGLHKSIILLQKIGQGIAKYPPVYITALTRDQQEKLFNILDRYSPRT
jgi:hypothetical protein